MIRMWCCVLWLAAGAAAAEIECPRTIQVRQVATDVPSGFTTAVSATPPQLASVTFFDGKPEEEASLVYDRKTPGRNGIRAYWTFQPSSQIWLSCSYSGTSVVLSRPLPGVTRCMVVYKKDITVNGLPEVDHIFCR